jgi:AraC-like DNA-binding protein
MLADTLWPISVIGMRSGFPNVANFNRQFRALKETTPAAYRKQFSGKAREVDRTSAPLNKRSPSLIGA